MRSPARMLGYLHRDDLTREVFVHGGYDTGDIGRVDEDGYVFIMGRTDDVINVAGHRLSTGAMEEVLADHPDVAECAVFGVEDTLKGQIPIGFLVLNAGVERDGDEIVQEVIQMVRERIGPVAAFKTVLTVKRLPKTRSGKIMRRVLGAISNKGDVGNVMTLAKPEIVEEIQNMVAK